MEHNCKQDYFTVEYGACGLRNLIRGRSVQLLLVIVGLLAHLGRKREMLHHTVESRKTNLLDFSAMDERVGENSHDQKKFDDAPETFKRSAPVLCAFLPLLLCLEVGDYLLRFVVHVRADFMLPIIESATEIELMCGSQCCISRSVQKWYGWRAAPSAPGCGATNKKKRATILVVSVA